MQKATTELGRVARMHPATVIDPWVTKNELARELRLNPRTLDNWRFEGKGPRGVIIGRKLLYRRSEINRWAEEMERREYGE